MWREIMKSTKKYRKFGAQQQCTVQRLVRRMPTLRSASRHLSSVTPVPQQFYSASGFLLPVFSAFFVCIIFSSCQKVIHIDLNSSDKKYVIEGVVTNQPGTTEVLISQTKNFDESNNFVGVAGAAVSIADSVGNVTPLTETSPGVYQSASLTGTIGMRYLLSVNINGQQFTASSTMPRQVNMDTLYLVKDDLFSGSRMVLNVKFQDPPGKGDSYRFVQYVNNIKEKTLFIWNDDYTDGNINEVTLRYPDDDNNKKIKSGDSLRVDMLCIDPRVYQYWFSLALSGTGSNQSASPANPATNIIGGALGYFSAHTFQTRKMVAP